MSGYLSLGELIVFLLVAILVMWVIHQVIGRGPYR